MRLLGEVVAVMLGVIFVSVCCSVTDKAVVANAVAARTYWEDRYERACLAHRGPPVVCADAFDALTLLERHEPPGCDPGKPGCTVVGLIPVANRVQKIGRIPDAQRKELAAVLKRLEALP
jgi:hypothetical protein